MSNMKNSKRRAAGGMVPTGTSTTANAGRHKKTGCNYTDPARCPICGPRLKVETVADEPLHHRMERMAEESFLAGGSGHDVALTVFQIMTGVPGETYALHGVGRALDAMTEAVALLSMSACTAFHALVEEGRSKDDALALLTALLHGRQNASDTATQAIIERVRALSGM